MIPEFNAGYWENRYTQGLTQWDLGQASPPITQYIDQLPDRSPKILIPGAGNAHEAGYLHRKGFDQVFVMDISQQPLANFQALYPDFPPQQLLNQDFFRYNAQPFDLILEQTFFCALHPSLRPSYVQHMHRLLSPGGKLVGVLFGVPLNTDEPPFGGDYVEYLALFQPFFKIITMETCYNSIAPRAGRELFIILQKIAK
jgi:SAM-dependent methyltransferase